MVKAAIRAKNLFFSKIETTCIWWQDIILPTHVVSSLTGHPTCCRQGTWAPTSWLAWIPAATLVENPNRGWTSMGRSSRKLQGPRVRQTGSFTVSFFTWHTELLYKLFFIALPDQGKASSWRSKSRTPLVIEDHDHTHTPTDHDHVNEPTDHSGDHDHRPLLV